MCTTGDTIGEYLLQFQGTMVSPISYSIICWQNNLYYPIITCYYLCFYNYIWSATIVLNCHLTRYLALSTMNLCLNFKIYFWNIVKYIFIKYNWNDKILYINIIKILFLKNTCSESTQIFEKFDINILFTF